MPEFLAATYALRSISYHNSMMIDICDLQLIGTRLEEKGLVITLSKEYYQQEIIEESSAREMLRVCSIASLVGERIVKQALEMRLATAASVRKISGVPFLMIYKFQN
jgi:uncharacterized protein